MYKKIIAILIIILIVLNCFTLTAFASNPDQHQDTWTNSQDISIAASDYNYLQSFKPTKSNLAYISVVLHRVSTLTSGYVTIGIFDSLPLSIPWDPLISLNKGVSTLPTSANWVDFDFTDITVIPGHTYYINIVFSNIASDIGVYWHYATGNPYSNGKYYRGELLPGSTIFVWYDNENWDFTFRTYNSANTPPTCSLSASPSSGEEPFTTTFSMSASDPDGSIDSWELDIDNSGDAEYSGTGNPPSTKSHTYYNSGDYTAKLTIYDNQGATDSDTATVNVEEENNPPIAYIDTISPNPSKVGATISFSGHGSVSEGTITGYNWRSSIDKQLSTKASFNTSSLSVGTHTIYFKVKDNNDIWSSEVTENLVVNQGNLAPSTPITPFGPTIAYDGDTCTFISSTTDPEGDKISYRFRYKDAIFSWSDYIDSGEYISYTRKMSIIFPDEIKDIKVQAKDEYGLESDWSDPLIVDVRDVSTSTVFTYPYNYCYHYNETTSYYDYGLDATSACNPNIGYIGTHVNITLVPGTADARASIKKSIYVGREKDISFDAEIITAHGASDILNSVAGTFKWWGWDNLQDTYQHEDIDPPITWDELLSMILQILGAIVPPLWLASIPLLIVSLASAEYDFISTIYELKNWLGEGVDIININSGFFALPGVHNIILGLGSLAISYATLLRAEALAFGYLLSLEIDGIAPPRTPMITGPDNGLLDQSYNFIATCNDPNNDQIKYNINWGDGTSTGWTEYIDSGSSLTKSHTYTTSGNYIITVQSEDIDKMKSETNYHLIKIAGNQPPSKPDIDGPSKINYENKMEITVVSIDPEDDDVYYMINWGDGVETDWKGPYDSGESKEFSHAYSKPSFPDYEDDYTIKVKAKDVRDAESGWATLALKVPKYISLSNNFYLIWQKLFNHFPFFEKILNLYFN